MFNRKSWRSEKTDPVHSRKAITEPKSHTFEQLIPTYATPVEDVENFLDEKGFGGSEISVR